MLVFICLDQCEYNFEPIAVWRAGFKSPQILNFLEGEIRNQLLSE